MHFYSDTSAKQTYVKLRYELEPFIAKNFPSFELSHVGFSQNFDTEEVIIKLHINKKGRVKCSTDISDQLLLGETK